MIYQIRNSLTVYLLSMQLEQSSVSVIGGDGVSWSRGDLSSVVEGDDVVDDVVEGDADEVGEE